MSAKVFFDTSVLLYLLAKDDERAARAESLLRRGGYISVQVLNEFATVSRRKLKLTYPEVNAALADIQLLCEPAIAVDLAVHQKGMQIAARYRLQIYDSMILAAALACGCTVLYSEDMQHGQRINDTTIRNPFLDQAE